MISDQQIMQIVGTIQNRNPENPELVHEENWNGLRIMKFANSGRECCVNGPQNLGER